MSELYLFDRRIQERDAGVLAGVDEAGRGPLAGPVVAAAVVLDLNDPIDLLNDSKKLSPARREKVYGEIVSRARGWAAASATPAEIDTHNILRATLLAMQRALDALALQARCTLVLVDGNQRIPTFSGAQETLIKGDGRSASVAAASIIAKVTRDRVMHQLHERYPGYGFASHKGYPTREHRQALAALGPTPVHRRSFCASAALQCRLAL